MSNNMLFEWKIKRAGTAMTITHSTGKLTNVLAINATPQGIKAMTSEAAYILMPMSPARSACD